MTSLDGTRKWIGKFVFLPTSLQTHVSSHCMLMAVRRASIGVDVAILVAAP